MVQKRGTDMSTKTLGNAWQKNNLWKLLKKPTVEVVVAIVVVLGAAWIVVQAETETRGALFPIPFAHR